MATLDSIDTRNHIVSTGQKIRRLEISYTREKVTNLTFDYQDGSVRSLFEKDEQDTLHVNVEDLELAEDEEVISVWCDRIDNSKGFHRLLVGTSYGRVTKLCGNVAPSKSSLESLYRDGHAISGFSDGNGIFQWAPRATGFRVDGVMTTLEISISGYERFSKSVSSNTVGSGTGVYKELVDSIIIVVHRFIGDVRTLKLLTAGNEKGLLGDLGRRNRTIKYYTDECHRQLHDIATRFRDLFLVIKGARTRPERVQIFEELSVMSSVHIVSSHFTQWQGWVIGCKDKLIHGLRERVEIAKTYYETTKKLYTTSKETRSQCSCTKILVLYDYEASERARVSYECAEERLKDAIEERAALQADFVRLLKRVRTWEANTVIKTQSITTITTAPDTSDIPGVWPPTEISPNLGPEGFWKRIREIWEIALGVWEIRQCLESLEEIEEIFKTLKITIVLDPPEPPFVVKPLDVTSGSKGLNTVVTETQTTYASNERASSSVGVDSESRRDPTLSVLLESPSTE